MTPRTLSEISAMVTKAARGAGCSWGIAEEAGAYARVIEAHGLPGVTAVATLLSTPRRCACSDGDGAECGLKRATDLSDRLVGFDGATESAMISPLLLLGPLLLQTTASGACFKLSWPGTRLIACADGLKIDSFANRSWAAPQIRPCTRPETIEPPDWKSRSVSDKAWTVLNNLAARTLVPETEASRASGAGPTGEDTD